MSDEALVPVNENEGLLSLLGGGSKYATPEVKEEVSKASDFLPILQVLSSNSTIVKETAGTENEVKAGQFGLRRGKDKYDQYGPEIVIMACSWRPKAMIFAGPVSFFDPDSKEYQDVKDTADRKDSGKAFGPEFLLWLPDHEKLCTLFLGSKTGRNSADDILDNMEAGSFLFRLKIKVIRGPRHVWHGFETFPYDLAIKTPDMDYLKKQKEKFDNPPAMEAAQSGEEAEASERD